MLSEVQAKPTTKPVVTQKPKDVSFFYITLFNSSQKREQSTSIIFTNYLGSLDWTVAIPNKRVNWDFDAKIISFTLSVQWIHIYSVTEGCLICTGELAPALVVLCDSSFGYSLNIHISITKTPKWATCWICVVKKVFIGVSLKKCAATLSFNGSYSNSCRHHGKNSDWCWAVHLCLYVGVCGSCCVSEHTQ